MLGWVITPSGSLWQSLAAPGNPWQPLAAPGSPWQTLATPGRSFPEFDLITGVGLLISAQEWCQKVARHVLHVARAEYCMRSGVTGCYGLVVSVTFITAL